jgi:uncharacterized protein YjbI with pentapeptide repeats
MAPFLYFLILVFLQRSTTSFTPSAIVESRPVSRTTTATNSLLATTQNSSDFKSKLHHLAVAAVFSLSVILHPDPSFADGSTEKFKLPPIDKSDVNRCTLSSSSMGQANAARDKLYDLRQCDLSGKNANGFDLSGVIMQKTDASKAKFQEAYFSKGYLRDSNFDGADFTNAVVDRANFQGSTLRGTVFQNAVLTGTSFAGANVEGADFTDAYLGDFDIRSLCANPSLKVENPTTGADTLNSVGCKAK